MSFHTICAKSSSGSFYTIELRILADGRMTMTCDCNAGTMGDFCKHRRGVFDGDCSVLFNMYDAPRLRDIQATIQDSQLLTRYRRYLDELAALEFEKKELSKRQSAIKSAFAKELSQGV
jgi:hypothetical protein